MKSLSASLGAGSALFVCLTVALASPTDPASLEFFEKEIRPLLADRCYECHSAQTATPFAGLRLDRREDLIKGGVSGPAVVPGKPEESPLILRIQGRPALMPPTGALSDAQIRSLIEWVKMGAPWTDLAEASQASAGGFDLEARKRSHWAWQPVRSVPPPAVADTNWPLHPMDRFILAKLEQEGLEPAPAADRYTLIRRLSYDLRGLPPLPGEVQAFVADSSPRAYENLVDDFLDSASFRRAMGPPLDGPGPLQRIPRQSRRSQGALRLALPRLPDSGSECRHPLRPADPGTSGGRPASLPQDESGPGDQRVPPGHGSLPHGGAWVPAGGPPGRPHQVDRQPGRRRFQGVSGTHHLVRALPRPQVRRHQPRGLLRPVRSALRSPADPAGHRRSGAPRLGPEATLGVEGGDPPAAG